MTLPARITDRAFRLLCAAQAAACGTVLMAAMAASSLRLLFDVFVHPDAPPRWTNVAGWPTAALDTVNAHPVETAWGLIDALLAAHVLALAVELAHQLAERRRAHRGEVAG